MAALRLTLFGSPLIEVDDRPVVLPRNKAVALLAYLAMTGRLHRRDHLAGMLWPDYVQPSARTYLRQALYTLNGSVGKRFFLIEPNTLGLGPDADLYVDVLDFLAHVARAQQGDGDATAHLSQAVAIAQNEFMAGFSIPDAPMFEEWQLLQRESLQHTLDNVLKALISHHQNTKEYAEGIRYAQLWIAMNQLNEPAHCALMQLYALLGRKAAALHHYEEVVRLLRDELDAPPSNETVSLFEMIRENRIETEPGRRAGAGGVGHAVRESEPVPLHNLPSPVTSLVGRTSELAEIADHLASQDCRLLTIWGIGGMGKTRLALAAASQQLGSPLFPEGVYHVPLVPLSRPQQIVPAIAAALNFPLDTSGGDQRRSPEQQLLDFLHAKRLLLLLDNLEHLPEVGGIITDILEAANGVKVLATSRERLRLPGEQVYPLAGLQYPSTDANGDVFAFSAPQLFMARAQHSQPHFSPSPAETADLVGICQVVDGMPLALELAAAWIDTLSLSEIRQELEASLGFLATDAAGIVDRHRSMEIAFDASWQRLTAKEQRVFARLSVFRGGFTRKAAEQVADASLTVLSALVGKSFVRFHHEQGRYEIHELMRQYGADRLAEDHVDEGRTRNGHAAFFCALLQEGYEALKGSRQLEALAELNAEQGNLQVAWERATGQCNLVWIEQAMDGLGRFCEWTGNLVGGAAAFSSVAEGLDDLSGIEDRRVQAHSLAWLANFELLSGRTEEAEQHLAHSLALLDELADEGADVQAESALALFNRGHLELPRNLEAAAHAYSTSGALYEQIARRWESATAQAWYGEAEREIGNVSQAIGLLRRAEAVFQEFGDQRSVAMVLEAIARSYLLDQADLETALETAQASLQLRRQSGDRAGIASTLLTLSYVYCWLNQPELAEPLMEEALVIAKDLGHRSAECEAYYIASTIYNYLEEMEKKLAAGERGLELARELGDVRLMSNFLRSLGNSAVIRGDFEAAHAMHVEAFDVQEQAGIQVMLPWLHVVTAYSSWKVNLFEEAQRHIAYALNACVERTDYYTVVHALLFLAQVVAVQGDLERAVEIGATGRAVSRWEKSLTGRKVFVEPLEDLTESLPPEVAETAKERGQARDVFEVASQLLDEVQAPDWCWT